ncbi:MAG TPA: type II toxin-antitoxin system antitoxin SocA domain-containing protein [Nannocystis sp.]
MTVAKVSHIARYFLALAVGKTGEMGSITPLKLQKLVYYAQGYHLAMAGEPLFAEVIQAWAHGPVVPELYHQYKGFEHRPIPPAEGFDPGVLSEGVRRFLEDVFADRAPFTAWHLREMTHAERPWLEAFVHGQNAEITHASLARYFAERFRLELRDLADPADAVLSAVLAEHPELPVMIHMARRELDRRFGPDAVMSLSGYADPEEDFQCAVLRVYTELPLEELKRRRNLFDEEWWLERMGGGRLLINFEPRPA